MFEKECKRNYRQKIYIFAEIKMNKIRLNNSIDLEEQRISFWEDSSEEIAQNATNRDKEIKLYQIK